MKKTCQRLKVKRERAITQKTKHTYNKAESQKQDCPRLSHKKGRRMALMGGCLGNAFSDDNIWLIILIAVIILCCFCG